MAISFVGLIEVVPDSETIGSITAGKSVHLKKIRAMANVYDERRLKKWLKSKGESVVVVISPISRY